MSDESPMNTHTLESLTPLPDVGSRNDPYRAGKRQLSEGGIHTTMFVSWPGVIASGRTFSFPVTAIDLTPTILAAAERPEAADASIEGINLLPLLRGTRSELATCAGASAGSSPCARATGSFR